VAVARESPPVVGELTTAVGYGESDNGVVSSVRRQRGNVTVLSVGAAALDYKRASGTVVHVGGQPGELVTGESICNGDSGGPLLDPQGQVVGVTSRSLMEDCTDAPSIFSDVASHLDLIDRALTAAGHPSSAEPAGATGPSQAKSSPADASAPPSTTPPPSRSARGC
jgi:hypothetical protein